MKAKSTRSRRSSEGEPELSCESAVSNPETWVGNEGAQQVIGKFNRWSRVLSVTHQPMDFTVSYKIAEDLSTEQEMQSEFEDEEGDDYEPPFDSQAFLNAQHPLRIRDYKLSEQQYRKYALQAVSHRRELNQ